MTIEEIAAQVSKEFGMTFAGVEYDFAEEVAKRAIAAEREACVKVCEAAEDTGNDQGIERDVAAWNKATAYCVRRIKERSNAELSGDGPASPARRPA